MSGPISVVIAEDSLLVRDSVHRALSTDPDVNVVGIAEDYDSAVELIEKHRPTMLFTDVRMPPTSTDEGIRLARWMRTAHPDIGVIVLSQYADPHYVTGLLDGGTAARGYLLKERVSHFDQLSEAVHQVAAGGTVLDPLVVDALLAQPSSAATLSRLTPREREVLAELATGLSNRTVAQRLVLSQRAVEKHINSIFAKLGLTVDDSVDRRVKAVLMFLGDNARRTRRDVHTMRSVVCTPWCAPNSRSTIRRWRKSGCGYGSWTTRPVFGSLQQPPWLPRRISPSPAIAKLGNPQSNSFPTIALGSC